MNALLAAPLGIAAALVGTADDTTAQAAEAAKTELVAPPAAELAADRAQLCDDKCQVIALTERILPNTGAADLLSIALEPEEHVLNIPSTDGTPAVSIKVDPFKLTRGEALVATAKF